MQHHERAPTNVVVERRDGVGVLAVDGDRRWWRETTVARKSGEAAVEPVRDGWNVTLAVIAGFGDRQSLLSESA